MKKTITILLLAMTAIGASAQTASDAMKFAETNYYGTARSLALGNAFTALGGDLGSITINPAGSAVNNYSQVTLTPGLSIVSTSASYNAAPTHYDIFGRGNRSNKVNFSIPNIGIALNYETGLRRGLKNVTFGIVANSTQIYKDNLNGSGTNPYTTFAGSIAARSNGIEYDVLNGNYAYDNADWLSVIGLKSGMIAALSDNSKEYIGATEKLYSGNQIQLAGPVDQVYGRQASGNKYDMVFNVGFNFSDRFFLGANLGILTIDYSKDEYFKEYAVNPEEFGLTFTDANNKETTTYFNSLRYRYSYDVSGAGVYGKIGFIYVPVNFIRLGAAIQTRTATFLKESWQHAGETHYDNPAYDASAKSPLGEYKYKYVAPFKANFGAAVTFGRFGLLSVDYEYTDYAGMKFKETETNDNSTFDDTNKDIKDFSGGSHLLRAGIEVKPVPEIAIRAGYNFQTSGERYYDSYGNKKAPKSYRNAFSLGLGYSSKGSFFCDVAARMTRFPYEYIYPYEDYIYDNGKITELTPEIRNRKSLIDVVATFGWRF